MIKNDLVRVGCQEYTYKQWKEFKVEQIEQTETEKQSLEASAIKSIPAGDSKSIYLAGLAGLIIIGIGSVFLLRKKFKPDIPEADGLKADDFEITE